MTDQYKMQSFITSLLDFIAEEFKQHVQYLPLSVTKQLLDDAVHIVISLQHQTCVSTVSCTYCNLWTASDLCVYCELWMAASPVSSHRRCHHNL